MSSLARVGKPKAARARASSQPSLPLLRRLRLLSVVAAVGSGVLVPFELGAVTAANLASLPVVGRLFPKPIGFLSIRNSPFTAVVGRTERFSVQLENQPHAPLVYELYYPDGRVVRAHETSDKNGFSSHIFRIDGYRPTQFREAATIGVQSVPAAYQAYLHFAIQQDRPTPLHLLTKTPERAKIRLQHVKLVHLLRLDHRVRDMGSRHVPMP